MFLLFLFFTPFLFYKLLLLIFPLHWISVISIKLHVFYSFVFLPHFSQTFNLAKNVNPKILKFLFLGWIFFSVILIKNFVLFIFEFLFLHFFFVLLRINLSSQVLFLFLFFFARLKIIMLYYKYFYLYNIYIFFLQVIVQFHFANVIINYFGKENLL
jgi:hypothetical protein